MKTKILLVLTAFLAVTAVSKVQAQPKNNDSILIAARATIDSLRKNLDHEIDSAVAEMVTFIDLNKKDVEIGTYLLNESTSTLSRENAEILINNFHLANVALELYIASWLMEVSDKNKLLTENDQLRANNKLLQQRIKTLENAKPKR